MALWKNWSFCSQCWSCRYLFSQAVAVAEVLPRLHPATTDMELESHTIPSTALALMMLISNCLIPWGMHGIMAINTRGEFRLKKVLALLLLVWTMFLVAGCSSGGSSSSGRRKCGYCGGAGYIRNGATNAAEYAFMKKSLSALWGKRV